MRAALPYQFVRLLVFALFSFASFTFAQTAPPDDTSDVVQSPQDPAVGETGADQDNPTERLEWQRKAYGVVSPEFRALAIREGEKHSRDKKKGGPAWVSIGPTGADYEQNGSFTGHVRDSGRARKILPHPTDPNVVYFLTSGGGLWKTENWMSNNTEWRPLTDDLPTTGGGSAAFGRTPNVIYLGLGDPYDQILVGGSMVKSIDGGESWSPMIELGSPTPPPGNAALSVRDVKVDTSGPVDIVLVATDNGLFRSADGGATYSAVASFVNHSVWSIERTSAGWLASGQPCPAANVGLQCGQPTTLRLSTDGGATWAPITNAGNVLNGIGRTTLAVAAPGDSVVYAYANFALFQPPTVPPNPPPPLVPDGSLKDIYKSVDGGQTWIANNVLPPPPTAAPITNPVAGMTTMNICHAQCWYNQSILVDPRDSNIVWVGGDLATARSTDGGATWTLKSWWLYSQFNNNPNLPYAHADHHAAAFKSTGTPTIILGNDGGLNITTDNGATFSSDKNNGLVTHLYYTVAGNPEFPSLSIGGTQDNGTRLRIGQGTIHNQVIGGDGMGAAYSQANTNTVFGSSQGSGMRTNFSNNPPTTFQNWAAATAGLSDVGFGFFTAILPAPADLDATGRVFFHFSNSRVWRSNNGGLNWRLIGAVPLPEVNPPQPGSPGLPALRRFRSSPYNIGVSPTDLNRIAVGAGGGFLDITTNALAAEAPGNFTNTNWVDLNLIALVPGYQGFVTNVTWQDNQTLWITSVAQAAGSARVIKATIASLGDSWANASFAVMQNGLPDLPVTRILFDPSDASKNTIYAATHVGIYRTIDGGANWAPYGQGLPTVRVNDIYTPPDGGFIRIATYGRGIWELPQVEFVSAALRDDGRSCDQDGVLDNGESGHLLVTLQNHGSNRIHRIYATVSSSNPNVTFPFGPVVNFPDANGNEEITGALRVNLNGTSGIDSTDFSIAIRADDGLPSELKVKSTQRLNYNDTAAVASTETAESSFINWTATGDSLNSPNIDRWQIRALSPTRHVWWGPDNNGQRDDGKAANAPDQQSLISPTLHVGSAPLIISFEHRHAFEIGTLNPTPTSPPTGWDGGRIEISTDNGATWTNVGGPLYNGVIAVSNGLTDNPFGGLQAALVNRTAGWPAFVPATLNLGTAFANRDLKIRFRIATDSTTGAPGWELDNINVSGITNTPFGALVSQAGTCTKSASKGKDDEE